MVTPRFRNIALTVHELEDGEFHWVLMEAVDGAVDDVLPYMVLETAAHPQPNYSSALVAGVAAMRRLFGGEGPRRDGFGPTLF
ncbi:hypothetical protein ACFPPF_06780 [Xenophilus aerolatus]|jgi:hypothetical protein|nr:hypothetical protein [Xenophilus aerolatus]